MRLILVRHGETEENRKCIIQGQMQGKLTKNGIGQAKRLAERLRERKIDAIYSSDLARAKDTTKEIAKFHKGTKVVFTRKLRERNLGELTGKTREELGLREERFVVVFLNPKEGESREELYYRAKAFLESTLERHKRGTVLIVGHNGINKALAAAVLEKGPEGIKDIPDQENTAITSFEISKGKAELVEGNCTRHLE